MTTGFGLGCGMEFLARVRVLRVLVSASLPSIAPIVERLQSHAVHGPARPSTSRSLAMTPNPTQRCIPLSPWYRHRRSPMTALERADPSFAPRAPAESREFVASRRVVVFCYGRDKPMSGGKGWRGGDDIGRREEG